MVTRNMSPLSANQSDTRAYHLKAGSLRRVDLDSVNAGVVAAKCIELRLDCWKVMERLQFHKVRLPDRADKETARLAHRQQVSDDARAWADYLLTEKCRQMYIENKSMWPPQPHPWHIEDVLSMPVVLWIAIDHQRSRTSSPSHA